MLVLKEAIIYSLCFIGLFSATVLLLSFFENRKRFAHPKPTRFPKVSIIVPAFNEEATITKTLRSLLQLDYPKGRLEIIVIDDGSTDSTLAVARRFAGKGVSVFTKKNSGKADTLNFGLRHCTGEIVGALDADSFVCPDALKKMIPYFEKERVMCVVPSVKIHNATSILHKVQMTEFLSAVFIRKAWSYLGGIPVTPGPFTLYKKEFFDRYGGYDLSTETEDIEVALRIESKRYVIESVIDAIVYTTPVSGLMKVYKQRLRWFKGFIDNIWKYRKMMHPSYGNLGVFILPIAVISIILGIVGFSYSMAMLADRVVHNLINLYLVNFDISTWFEYTFDAFLINTGSLVIIPLVALIVAASIIIVSKQYSEEKSPVALAIVLFFAVYWAIYSVCWISAMAHSLRKKTVAWRG